VKQIELIRSNSVKLVSWDIDGTLYSIRKMKWRLLRRFLREMAGGRGFVAGKQLMALRRYQATIEASRSGGGALRQVPGQKNSREVLLQFDRRWYAEAIHRIGPRPGVTDLIMFFASQNIPQVASSDYQGAYKLESLGIQECFASVYEGEKLGFVKPSPRVFERIASDFDVPMENILHIGDRVDTDEAAARAAGCECLILGRDFQSFVSLAKQLGLAISSNDSQVLR